MLSELRDRAQFVTGIGAWERSGDKVLIDEVIENARRFIDAVTPAIGPPQITGGTTVDPETILSLYWHIEKNHQLYGVYVRLRFDATWQLNWIGPQDYSGEIQNIPISKLSGLGIIKIYYNIANLAKRE